MNPSVSQEIWDKFFNGNDWALGSILNLAENQKEGLPEVLKVLTPHTGNAHIIGITGPPGAGKSTLVNQLAKIYADNGHKVGVLCIDPSSPFTGGALLGDRVRMINLDVKSNVFIRSLASRGSVGGLSESTKDMVQVLDAAGKDIILVETVGIGQVAFDIMDIADTTVLVTVPGLGDRMQTLKAGIMEIADLFVVNQADREGADESVKDINRTLDEAEYTGWKPKVLATVALNGQGVEELYRAIVEHRDYLRESQLWVELRKKRSLKRFQQASREMIMKEIEKKLVSNSVLADMLEQVKLGKIDPYSGALKVREAVLGQPAISNLV